MADLKPGFFEFIGVADAERIHSEMISWMLSENSPLKTQKAKNHFLGALLECESNFEKINALTEFKYADIMIIAGNGVYIIENKLKSSEHSGQTTTETYERKIKAAINEKEGLFTGTEILKDKFYLTLIEEEAAGGDWSNISYRRVYDAFLKNSDREVNAEYLPIIKEYLNTLARLLNTVELFNLDHQNFPQVFTDGGQSKWKKIKLMKEYETEDQKYIGMCQLEKPLQRKFALRCVDKLNVKKNEYYRIGNSGSSGEVTIQIVFEDYDVKLDGKIYELGLQFQGRAIKLNLCIKNTDQYSYGSSSCDWLSDVVIDTFKGFAFEYGLTLNKPKTKAYLSMSRNLGKKNPLSSFSFEKLIELYNEELELARSRCSRVTEELEKIG